MAMQSGHVLDTASTVVTGCTYEPLRRTTSTAQRLPPVLVKVLSKPGYIGDHSSQYRAFWAFTETWRTFSESLHWKKRSVLRFLFVCYCCCVVWVLAVTSVVPDSSVVCCFPRYLTIVGIETIACYLIGSV